jgi:hypothetical protein
MRRHRNPRPKVSKRPSPDNRRTAPQAPEPEPDEFDHLIHTLRDNLRRADAFITTAERQIEENWHDDDRDDDEERDDEEEEENPVLRHRMRVEYLVEAGKYAVRGALYTTQRLDAVLGAHRRRA